MTTRLQEIQAKLPKEDADYLNGIYEQLEMAETDAVYYRMKFEGTWPGDKESFDEANT
jgi:hypothetical protein